MVHKLKNFWKDLRADFPASVVVFLIALPLCLGIALGSNAPLFSGIIAGIIGGIVIGFLSKSPLSVSGPAAGLTAIVLVAIGRLETFEIFLLSVFLAGIFQIIFGFIRAGVLGDYIPGCVIKGMLAAIGIILILKQLPHLAGYDKDFGGDQGFIESNGGNTFSTLIGSFDHFILPSLIIGILSLGLQFLWDKVLSKKRSIFRVIPAPLVVVLAGVAINQAFIAFDPSLAIRQTHLVNIPVAASLGEFASFFSFPDFSKLSNVTVWTTAITIAIVASLETMLNIEAADELDPYQRVTPANRELKAQGIGNMISGLIGGLPITSVIVRTSANVYSGAKSKASSIMHGMLLLSAVAFLPSVLNLIPLSALAAILIYTGYKLANIQVFTAHFRKGYDQFIPFIVTAVAILFSDLLIGILIGWITGFFFVMRSNFRSSVFVVHDNNHYLFRLRKDVSFLNKPIIKTKLEEVPAGAFVIIDMARADYIDRDVTEVIEDFIKHAPLKNINVQLKSGVQLQQGFNFGTNQTTITLNKKVTV